MWPLVECAVEPCVSRDWERLARLLAEMAAEDSLFAFHTDQETGQTLLQGADDRHLHAKLDLLLRRFGERVSIGSMQVAYRETIVGAAEVTYIHKRAYGRTGEYASVTIACEPIETLSSFRFENKASRLPAKFIEAVRDGLMKQKECGPLAGFPLIGVKAVLVDAKYHDADSTPLAFDIAGRTALRNIRKTGLARILEPVMTVEVTAPLEHAEAIRADFEAYGATSNERAAGSGHVITASAPLKSLLGYEERLRRLSCNTATFKTAFERYDICHVGGPNDLFPTAVGMRA